MTEKKNTQNRHKNYLMQTLQKIRHYLHIHYLWIVCNDCPCVTKYVYVCQSCRYRNVFQLSPQCRYPFIFQTLLFLLWFYCVMRQKSFQSIDITYGLSSAEADEIFNIYCNIYDNSKYYILARNGNYVYCVKDKNTFSTAGFTSTGNIGIQYIKG